METIQVNIEVTIPTFRVEGLSLPAAQELIGILDDLASQLGATVECNQTCRKEEPQKEPTIAELEEGIEYPKLPDSIHPPDKGWVYVGGGWRDADSNLSDDIAILWGLKWDYGSWHGHNADCHFAVRIGSDMHKEWLAWRKAQLQNGGAK